MELLWNGGALIGGGGLVNYVGRFFAAEFLMGFVGQAGKDLERSGEEEGQAGERERERPLEGNSYKYHR